MFEDDDFEDFFFYECSCAWIYACQTGFPTSKGTSQTVQVLKLALGILYIEVRLNGGGNHFRRLISIVQIIFSFLSFEIMEYILRTRK